MAHEISGPYNKHKGVDYIDNDFPQQEAETPDEHSKAGIIHAHRRFLKATKCQLNWMTLATTYRWNLTQEQ